MLKLLIKLVVGEVTLLLAVFMKMYFCIFPQLQFGEFADVFQLTEDAFTPSLPSPHSECFFLKILFYG